MHLLLLNTLMSLLNEQARLSILRIFSNLFALVKGKASVILFHGITFPYSYFEEIWIFAPIQQDYLVFLDHVLLWISWTEKFVDNTQQYGEVDFLKLS